MPYDHVEQMLRSEIRRALLSSGIAVSEIGKQLNVTPRIVYQLLGVIEDEKSPGARNEPCQAYFKLTVHIQVRHGQSIEDEAGRVNLLVKKALKSFRTSDLSHYEDDDMSANIDRIKPGKFDRSLSGTEGVTDIVFPVIFTQTWK